MKTTKICHLTSVHPRYDTRIFHKECKTLSNAGFDVNLIVADGKGDEIDKIKIYDVGKPINRKERMLKTTKKVFQKALEVNADIYHFHDPELIPIGLKLKKLDKKVIYDVHEDVPEQIMSKNYIPKSFRKILSIGINLIEKNSVRLFDYIVVPTDFIKSKFLKYNRKVIDVKNYISKQYIKNTIDKASKSNDFILIFAGSIYKERGILEGIKACNMLRELTVRFLIFGEMDSTYYSEIKEVDTLGRLDYKGVLPYEKILMELAKADIGFVCDYPLKRHMEGLPTKLFEYMAVGIPVIASNFPLWKEIVEKNNCGICVDPTNPEEIAKAIEYLITHPNEARKMGENGRKAVLEKYNWEKESEKLLNVYKEILDKK
jgi:glycosyltransferase involved in cell wall biosynthesis